jgi:hypothetical protein
MSCPTAVEPFAPGRDGAGTSTGRNRALDQQDFSCRRALRAFCAHLAGTCFSHYPKPTEYRRPQEPPATRLTAPQMIELPLFEMHWGIHVLQEKSSTLEVLAAMAI